MFVHPQIDPVALDLGPVAIHWYGVSYLAAFLVGWWAGHIRARQPHIGWSQGEVNDYLFYVVLGVVLGGRIGYMAFYGWDAIAQDPWVILRIWQGGMSFHGGMLGVIIATAFFARRTEHSFIQISDYVAPMIPIGLFCGRIANFINAELVGRVTDVPWAMIYPQVDQLPRHPSQLYQATLEGPVLFLILWLYARKDRPAPAVSGMFLLFYGLFRFFTEFFRQPDAHIGFVAFDWMTMGQALSLPMILAGAAVIAWGYSRKHKTEAAS